MNSGTGQVVTPACYKELAEPAQRAFDSTINPANLSRQAQRELARTGTTTVSRNAKCPCGSGKRFRKCHMKVAR